MEKNQKLKANNITLSTSLADNMIKIENKFRDCPDIVRKKTYLKNNSEAYFIYVEGLVNIDLLQRDFITPILSMEYQDLMNEKKVQSLPTASIEFHFDIDSMIAEILSGSVVFLAEGMSYSISCKLRKFYTRDITEPVTEKNIKGPHEGFVEELNVNMAILRKKVKDNNLKFKTLKIGAVTNQLVAIAYISGIANEGLLNNLYNKIKNINFDGMIVSGGIEQFITDFPYSPFPQYQTTERPDRATASLLEGKFVIILDGTPVALMVPVSFFSFFKALDDYSFDWIFGSFMGIIRMLAAFIAIFLPAIYIALVSFHYYMIPLNLIIPLAESRATIPFPPIIEALLMEIIIEMLREAAIRLPTYVGSSIGIVGGIIIGQAAVQAGIVSNLMVIIVSVTAIASFVIPSYNMGTGIRVIRFIIMIFSAIFGVIGIVICSVLILAHLVTLESLGQPYFQPIIPFKFKDLKDVIIRLPIKCHRLRPDIAKPVDKKRGKKNE